MLDQLNAKTARYMTILVFAVVALGIGLNGTGIFSADLPEGFRVRLLAGTLPSLFFLAAIWMCARALKALDQGQGLEVTLCTLLERLGLCLFGGGIAFVFGQPLLNKLILGDGAWGWFDIPAITLGCLGLLLYLLGRPLREAAQARDELSEIL